MLQAPTVAESALEKTAKTEITGGQRLGRVEALKRIFRRSVLLYLCGMFYHGGLSHPWPDVRFSGVLNRIALDYFFAAVLFCYFKPRALAGICAGLLIGYWALMTFAPVRDIQLTREHLAMLAERNGDQELVVQFRDPKLPNPTTVKNSPVWAATRKMFYGTTNWTTGKFEQGRNLSEHFDFQYLPGHYNGYEHAWAEPRRNSRFTTAARPSRSRALLSEKTRDTPAMNTKRGKIRS